MSEVVAGQKVHELLLDYKRQDSVAGKTGICDDRGAPPAKSRRRA